MKNTFFSENLTVSGPINPFSFSIIKEMKKGLNIRRFNFLQIKSYFRDCYLYVISSDPSCKDVNARCTKALTDQ